MAEKDPHYAHVTDASQLPPHALKEARCARARARVHPCVLLEATVARVCESLTRTLGVDARGPRLPPRRHFFATYKELEKNKRVAVGELQGVEVARAFIQECLKAYAAQRRAKL